MIHVSDWHDRTTPDGCPAGGTAGRTDAPRHQVAPPRRRLPGARARCSAWFTLAVVACATPRPPTLSTAPTSCFSVASVAAGYRQAAQRTLLDLADSEALYTLVGGVKPVSSGATVTWRVAPTLDTLARRQLDTLRALTPALQCAAVRGVVHVYAEAFRGGGDTLWRSASLMVVDASAVDAVVSRHFDFFTRLGVTPATPAPSVLSLVELARRPDRWRGYGYLFGFPDEAVDFFVAAGLRGDSTGRVEPRQFRRLETWRKVAATRGAPATLSTFVYAVAPDAAVSEADSALETRARAVYTRYAVARAGLGADSLRTLPQVLAALRRRAE